MTITVEEPGCECLNIKDFNFILPLIFHISFNKLEMKNCKKLIFSNAQGV